MRYSGLRNAAIASIVVAALALGAGVAGAQSAPTNSAPDPYKSITGWAKLPEGRNWGSTSAVAIDRDGVSVWVAERCGGNTCAGSNLPPILKFDPSGTLVKSFGAGLFDFPHGIYVDNNDNVWVTDAQGKDGKGQQVFKFSPDGKLLLTLGKAGVAGDGPDTFNQPSSVLVAPDGDIFVGDGHGGDSNARIVKFTKDGKFIKTWGKKGTAPGEFDTPHALAMDSRGRLFVGDRNNNRIQIFDQDGKFLDAWTQFSRPSGIYIDQKDNIYVADSEFGIGRQEPRRLEAGHPRRQRQGWRGDGLHSRPGRARHHDERRRRRCRRCERHYLWRRSRPETGDEVRHGVGRGTAGARSRSRTGRSLQSLAEIDDLDPPIVRAFGVGRVEQIVRSFTRRTEPIRGDMVGIDQVFPHGLGAALGQRDIVLAAARGVGMTFEHEMIIGELIRLHRRPNLFDQLCRLARQFRGIKRKLDIDGDRRSGGLFFRRGRARIEHAKAAEFHGRRARRGREGVDEILRCRVAAELRGIGQRKRGIQRNRRTGDHRC